MRNQARHFDSFTVEGKQKAQEIVNAINLTGGKARLGETWLDYGQSWAWETILCQSRSLDMEYQALSPRDFEEMNEGRLSASRIMEIISRAIL